MTITHSFQHGPVQAFQFGQWLFGRPKMLVYIYFVDGLLIDTGQPRMRKHILSTVKDLKVDQLFITHHHEDHTGNIPAIRALHNCPAYAGPRCAEMMKNPPKLSPAQILTWGRRPAQPDLIPKEGWLETRNYRFQLIPVPGHSEDMVALYEPEQKWLFSADLYINSYLEYYKTEESIADQIVSTKKILELDFNELFCCHRPRLTNGRQQLTKKLSFLETSFENVKRLYEQGCSAPEIMKRLKWPENRMVKFLSAGDLSKLNMVRSVIRDLEQRKAKTSA